MSVVFRPSRAPSQGREFMASSYLGTALDSKSTSVSASACVFNYFLAL